MFDRRDHRRRRRAAAVAGALALALVGASCSGGADPEISEGTPTIPGPAEVAGDDTGPGPSVLDATQGPGTQPVQRSAGCSTGTAGTGGSPTTVTVTVGGIGRTYVTQAPTGTAAGTPLPLVLVFHPYAHQADQFLARTHLAEKGQTAGFVVAAPQGIGAIPVWNVVQDPTRADDVSFVGAVLDHIGAHSCIDLGRVYAAGMELGGQLVTTLSCELSDRIAAAAVVAGAYNPDACSNGRPVPVVSFHGTDDGFQRYSGGLGPASFNFPRDPENASLLAAVDIPAAVDAAAAWAARNGCSGTPAQTFDPLDEASPDYEPGGAARLSHSCPDQASVTLYSLVGGGHVWPPGIDESAQPAVYGASNAAVNANDVMWELFSASHT